jgi:hypothetical protein
MFIKTSLFFIAMTIQNYDASKLKMGSPPSLIIPFDLDLQSVFIKIEMSFITVMIQKHGAPHSHHASNRNIALPSSILT